MQVLSGFERNAFRFFAAVLPLLLLGIDAKADSWRSAATMTTARSAHTATLLQSGQVLVAGGRGGGTNVVLDSAEIYDIVHDTWQPTGSLATARFGATATLLPNGKVLVVGGTDATFQATASAELYDPATGTWSS